MRPRRKPLGRAARHRRDAELVTLAAEVGVPEAARRVGLSRSRAFEVVGENGSHRARGDQREVLLQLVTDMSVEDIGDAFIDGGPAGARAVAKMLDALALWSRCTVTCLEELGDYVRADLASHDDEPDEAEEPTS